MLPSLTPLWFWLAGRLPDPAQRRHMDARQRIAALSRQLMAQWQDGRAAAAAAAANGQPTAGAAGGSFAEVGGGINSSSFLAALLEERRKGGGGGTEKLSDVQVIAQCLTFLLAGFETTSTTLAFTAFLLATHPEAQERLLREIDSAGGAQEAGAAPPQLPYLDAVLQESMRLLPAASALIRSPPEDLDLGDGLVIPRGQFVFLATNNFHLDPKNWPQPEAFLPERFLPESGGRLGPSDPAAFAPFGVGPRMCVGNKLAIMAAKSALVQLYRRFTFSLHAKQRLPLRTRTAMTHAPRDGVWVSVHAR
ncbi:Cytochrome P450 3A2 [Tetrabaena socialis]|uniref:Cytochrome P450 3A2 n=1 Tax=Tetrabaena socialis TaxID=47790 RepID=A0A2J8AA26_9CHLO|nr:Cytochrome P450 3A2 [Tetrabaena socialis]|eukprot:PNH09370.1 Cytochrome P450 3A2 [Tetrabaena socialis]